MAADPAYPWAVVGLEEEAVAGRVEGKNPDQLVCRCLGRRAYPLAHRTPVLYSRNQSRTNIALQKKMDRRGRDSLPSWFI